MSEQFKVSERNLTFLAHNDFLDLCLIGETGTSKTHTAEIIHETIRLYQIR